MALFASCRGQEAAQIGAAASLRKTDWLFPQYREIGAFLLRGITPAQMGAVWRGKWHGGLGFTEKCCAPISIQIGTHGLHAVGAAMGAQRLGEDSVTLAFLGDGATSEGDAHEALNFAAVFKAPCVFFVQNNQWAISVPVSHQMAAPSIAHRAIGYGMPGIRVDGNDVLACYAVIAEAAQRAREGGGPTLIEAITYRMGPHTTSDDPTRYRSQDEVDHWLALDPIARYRTYLQPPACGPSGWRNGSRPSRSDCEPNCASRWSVPTTSTSPRCSTRSTTTSPRNWCDSAKNCWPSWRRRRDMTQIIERPAMNGDDAPEPHGPMLTTVPTAPTLTMAQAINRALHDAMAADDRVLVFGEDVAKLGGVFRVTEGLAETFGEQRCFDTPLAESGIVGIAIGMAIRGFVPVPEIQFDGFAAPAFDQIVSHLAKYRMRTRGDVDMPVTIRIPSFGGIGAVEHHSESTESYWLHTAGLKVVVPSTPSDAYWLLRQAIVSRDPVIYLEPKRRYWAREAVDTYAPGLPIGRAAVRRVGADVTVVTYGALGRHRAQRGGTCRAARLEPGGHRPAVVEPARLRHRRGLRAQDRPRGGDARRTAHAGLRCRAGGPHSGGAVLRPGGTGVARHRV